MREMFQHCESHACAKAFGGYSLGMRRGRIGGLTVVMGLALAIALALAVAGCGSSGSGMHGGSTAGASTAGGERAIESPIQSRGIKGENPSAEAASQIHLTAADCEALTTLA